MIKLATMNGVDVTSSLNAKLKTTNIHDSGGFHGNKYTNK